MNCLEAQTIERRYYNGETSDDYKDRNIGNLKLVQHYNIIGKDF